MPKITKAILEETNQFLKETLDRREAKLSRAEQQIKNLREIIHIYQGMASFTIANERIAQALEHTLMELKRPTRNY